MLRAERSRTLGRGGSGQRRVPRLALAATPKDGSTAELDLGYRLRRSAWGRGYAAEGTRAPIRKAFADLGTQRVFAQTMAVNTRSRRVMERAGLRYLRTFHLRWDDPIPGTEHGEVEYELLREDWLQEAVPMSDARKTNR